MKSNIALIGFMGTGKTAVGQILAAKLKLKFIETDALIKEQSGKSIPQIFAKSGEIGFRELEIAATKKAATEKKTVIACGGGLVLNRINIERLRQNAIIVYLTASPKETLRRISREAGQRPLLDVENPLEAIRDMVKFRRPFYERAADITVNTNGMTPEGVANDIIRTIRENASLNR
jgi:shikimate kinase